MKFSAVLFSSVLFATSALAAPRSGLSERVARRAAGTRLTHPLVPGPSATTSEGPESDLSPNVTHPQYSTNWAGAVLTAPPAGQTFKSVVGTFTVPKPSVPSGGKSGSYSGSGWVGIDGDTYGAAILQTGIDWTVTSGGAITYDAWYEWYPNYAIDFTGITLAAGNTIKVTVTSSSASAGTAIIQNVSTGKTVSKALTAPSSSSHLGGQNAEWIVEAFQSGNSQVNLANFGTVTFSGASTSTQSQTLGVSGATIIDMETSSGSVLTDVTTPSSSQVVIKYV
ncbi:hypothetical protein MMC25_004821 [Agyrium rufum]|nr:hypothetical protein [Agyrium rufum]